MRVNVRGHSIGGGDAASAFSNGGAESKNVRVSGGGIEVV